VGEFLDKGSNLLKLPGFGGSFVEKYASVYSNNLQINNNYSFIFFSKNFKFSYSGIKSFFSKKNKSNINVFKNSFYMLTLSIKQELIQIQIFFEKKYKGVFVNSLSVSGGVAKNNYLKKSILYLSKKYKVDFLFSKKKNSEDNSFMTYSYFKIKKFFY
jgi:tRNA A37 threonylcarbamoyltransferase TsaD